MKTFKGILLLSISHLNYPRCDNTKEACFGKLQKHLHPVSSLLKVTLRRLTLDQNTTILQPTCETS